MTITELAVTSPERLPVAGTANFRAVAAPAVRPGSLFRADALRALGDEGRDALRALGITRIVDLRSDDEAQEAPDDIAGLDVEVDRIPIMGGSIRDAMAALAGPDGLGDFGLVDVYVAMLTDGGAAFGRALQSIAAGGTTVVHCTAGKDRTGIAVALALLAVGVDLDDVLADYARTEANLAGPWVDGMAARLAAYGVPFEGALREIVAGSPAPALRDALEQVALVEGSADAYLAAIGVDDAVRAGLRETLLAD